MPPLPRAIGRGARFTLAVLLAPSACTPAPAPVLRVAVASNFAATARVLADTFSAATGEQVVLSAGATGTLATQIRQGAPFDLFLAADTQTPARLEMEGSALAGTRSSYALGRLALWSASPRLVDSLGQVLKDGAFRHLAIANPALAPYGSAAIAVIRGMGLLDTLRPRFVIGENISQTLQFVESGNAELGFVAWSQLAADSTGRGGSVWLVPDDRYPPIKQQMVILHDSPTARAFHAFLQAPRARAIMQRFGYRAP